ncbi:MAG: sulfite exporter TauE/SafE family protein [Bacteroidetes bacterium]|nr:sulfite exporter TauE/SafE family protein [Bacteroidota bacterium]
MLALSYLAAAAIGISLGLIGGGGSILTVPVLVYLFGVEPVVATGYSLFIVGTTALVGAIPKYRQGLVNLKTAAMFGIPSIVAVFTARAFLVPMIPTIIFQVGDWVLTKNILIMVFLAILMVAASFSMIRNKKVLSGGDTLPEVPPRNFWLVALDGIMVGTVTGSVGVGGGFLIIPALVILIRLPMKEAIGTSLAIIAANSLIGFTGDLAHRSMDWVLLLSITAIAVLGIIVGDALSKKVDGLKLKKGFGWFILVMGVYIILKEWFSSVG